MKAAKFTFLHRVTASYPSAALIITTLILTVATTAASGQTNIFVPGNTNGCFGSPVDECNPLVTALAVSGPATITVTYVSGIVTDIDGDIGPNGIPCNCDEVPLEEAVGVSVRNIPNLCALIGVFVPQARVQYKGFNPIDGSKNETRVGILPNGLFFIGASKTFSVSEAGTLYLGINDNVVGDNGGGFNVTVTGP